MAVQKTARVQNKDIMHPDNNFLQLNRNKNPGEITCPQTASPGTVPAGVERHYPWPMKRLSARISGIRHEIRSRMTETVRTYRTRRSCAAEEWKGGVRSSARAPYGNYLYRFGFEHRIREMHLWKLNQRLFPQSDLPVECSAGSPYPSSLRCFEPIRQQGSDFRHPRRHLR